MPSAFILAVLSYPALPLARQLAHQRYVPPNPLVLGRKPLKFPTPTTDRDRPVSRRSKPSSTLIHHYWWRRLYHHPDGLKSGARRLITIGSQPLSHSVPLGKKRIRDQSLQGYSRELVLK